MPSRLYEIRELYFQQSRYSDGQEEMREKYPPLIQLPTNGYFERLKVDADLLESALAAAGAETNKNLSEQVFGSAIKHQQVNLKHQAHLLYERAQLHKQHIRDIDDRHRQIQEKLFGVEINNFPDRSKRMGNLEGQLLQLEKQRRDEELAFWKDTVELRHSLFELAGDYSDIKRRSSVLSGLEEKDGR